MFPNVFPALRSSRSTRREAPRPGRYRPTFEALESRLVMTTLPAGFTETLVASGMPNPTAMGFAPDGRLFVAQQGGQLRVIQNGQLLPTPFLSVNTTSTGERGLLGVTFDPNFASNGFVYVYYTVPTAPIHNRVSRFTANPQNPNVALPGSEQLILRLDNLSGATNHNGGAIHFTQDNTLLVAVGDNANSANAQSLSTLHGKVLRVYADGSVPASNPFVGTPGVRPEIFHYGFRNPFTFNVDNYTNSVYVNDVGQSGTTRREEVNNLYYQTGYLGGNYGWPRREGYSTDPDLVSPDFAYPPGFGGTNCSVNGGAFYSPLNNFAFPGDYYRTYFFADLCGGWIKVLNQDTLAVADFASNTTAAQPVDVQVNNDGSLYYLARGSGGRVYRIDYTGAAPGAAPGLPGLDRLVADVLAGADAPSSVTLATPVAVAVTPAVAVLDQVFANPVAQVDAPSTAVDPLPTVDWSEELFRDVLR